MSPTPVVYAVTLSQLFIFQKGRDDELFRVVCLEKEVNDFPCVPFVGLELQDNNTNYGECLSVLLHLDDPKHFTIKLKPTYIYCTSAEEAEKELWPKCVTDLSRDGWMVVHTS